MRRAAALAGVAAALALLPVQGGSSEPAATPYVIRAARLTDGRGGPPIAPAMVRVQGDKIIEVGSQVVIPPGAKVIDLAEATLLPGLIDRKGAVINLSSVAATYPYRGGCVYAGTKAFVRQFSLGLRCDLHGTGVRVTSIEPGMVETEFTIVRTGGDKAASDALYAGMDPMTASDIAETIWWVASLPPHVNINALELMPTNQSWAGFAVHRQE